MTMASALPSPPVFTAEAISTARAWLEECQSSHPSCRKKARIAAIGRADLGVTIIHDIEKAHPMPRRLVQWTATQPAHVDEIAIERALETNAALDPATTTVKVVDLNHKAPESAYVALSHRWGEAEQCLLLASNIAEWEKGKPLAELPRLFREAIAFAQGLGFNQIWIDQLCIIQGDDADWKAEGRRMGVIYGNAALTIAAEDTSSGDQGLYGDEDTKGILGTRAWVTQERVLAPRTLTFGVNGIVWECREADTTQEAPTMRKREIEYMPESYWKFFEKPHPVETILSKELEKLELEETTDEEPLEVQSSEGFQQTNEVYPLMLKDGVVPFAGYGGGVPHGEDPRPPAFDRFDKVLQSRLRRIEVPTHPKDIFCFFRDYRVPGLQFNLNQSDLIFSPKGNHERLYCKNHWQFLRVWWQLIKLYSERDLTFMKDKFLAVAGIASLAQRWTLLSSMHGLWDVFLPTEMLWHVDPYGPPGSYEDGLYYAPSFSWAALKTGRVRNRVYESLPVNPQIMIGDTYGISTGYDKALPLGGFNSLNQNCALGVRGRLRQVWTCPFPLENGNVLFYTGTVPGWKQPDSVSHWFMPDRRDFFPPRRPIELYMMHVVHYENFPFKDRKWKTLDLYLMLGDVEVSEDGTQIDAVGGDVSNERHSRKHDDPKKPRPMTRLGYVETKATESHKVPEDDFAWHWVKIY